MEPTTRSRMRRLQRGQCVPCTHFVSDDSVSLSEPIFQRSLKELEAVAGAGMAGEFHDALPHPQSSIRYSPSNNVKSGSGNRRGCKRKFLEKRRVGSADKDDPFYWTPEHLIALRSLVSCAGLDKTKITPEMCSLFLPGIDFEDVMKKLQSRTFHEQMMNRKRRRFDRTISHAMPLVSSHALHDRTSNKLRDGRVDSIESGSSDFVSEIADAAKAQIAAALNEGILDEKDSNIMHERSCKHVYNSNRSHNCLGRTESYCESCPPSYGPRGNRLGRTESYCESCPPSHGPRGMFRLNERQESSALERELMMRKVERISMSLANAED